MSRSDIDSIVAGVKRLDMRQDQTICVLLADHGRPDLNELVSELRQFDRPFFGGFFPGLIHESHYHDHGAILASVVASSPPIVLTDLDRTDNQGMERISELARHPDRVLTAFVLIDGLARGIGRSLNTVYHNLGHNTHYFGGGAGSLTLEQEPCIFTFDGVYQNAAIVVCCDFGSALGVRHGWQVLEEPLVATHTDGNRILEINWEDAFSVYRAIVEADSGQRLTADSFFEIASNYPFGMYRHAQEGIIRDPIAVDKDRALICVGEVPENTTLAVMKGDDANLVSAARRACSDALESETNEPSDPADTRVWVADCVSRKLFLGDNFNLELQAIDQAARGTGITSPVQGILTLGEISSHGDGMLEFLNKTVVIGAFHAKQ